MHDNRTTYCQVPIEGFNVTFMPSRTLQREEWAPLIYIAADTIDKGESVSEILQANITTMQGNPIDYFIEWTGITTCDNTSVNPEVSLCMQEHNSSVAGKKNILNYSVFKSDN